MKEEWRQVIAYKAYEVSNKGNVRSYYKKGTNQLGVTPKKMKIQTVSHGYCAVCINRRNKLVHRLVAKAFIPNPKNKPCINHKNGIKDDNRVENLEWCTRSENMKHAYKNGLQKAKRGENNPFSQLKATDVLQIRSVYEQGWATQTELSVAYNKSFTTIYRIVKRKIWRHI